MSKLKKIPKFKSEDDEFEFWSTHDSTEYIDYSKGKRAFVFKAKAIYQNHIHQIARITN